MNKTADTLIQFSDVQKSYDGKSLVIKNLSLSIFKGEFLTLLGASGSGKTTTLMMLAGFESPTRGEIRMRGKPIEHVPAHQRGMGMVFQNYALFPHMSVAENLAYPLKMRRMDRTERDIKVKRAIDMVQLHGMEQRRPTELSGGQQQRVALARAMVFEPDVILMDEPLGALDKNLREHMQYEIKQLHRSLGVTVVYVTHDQSEALTMSDRVAVFHKGDIAQIGSPSTLYERPNTAYVANFIGENNTLTGTPALVENGCCHISLAGGVTVKGSASHLNGYLPKQVELIIRPEKIRLTEASETSYRAVVTDKVYLGEHIRVHLQLANEHKLVVRVANDQASRNLQCGHITGFRWDVADAHAFPLN
ncbi:polyamine-transporting ATPase [Pseudomonas asuensis]|uniref:Spermidine/putrescine import ATP-binding protein PotA n=1 Tax=Pseudomonas asuensis TaxID=1825787 RepID=A0ABQ2H2M1_9PSED|nr:ABC transporter ATP-binding protein [Pseudomonas asuensis]GGM29229.1 polyamine-transporting ATPase [Pseudomonas asuensis]